MVSYSTLNYDARSTTHQIYVFHLVTLDPTYGGRTGIAPLILSLVNRSRLVIEHLYPSEALHMEKKSPVATEYDSDVRHPRCVLYNSKELSAVMHILKHNYICLYYYNEGSNNDMFRPYMWTISCCK